MLDWWGAIHPSIHPIHSSHSSIPIIPPLHNQFQAVSPRHSHPPSRSFHAVWHLWPNNKNINDSGGFARTYIVYYIIVYYIYRILHISYIAYIVYYIYRILHISYITLSYITLLPYITFLSLSLSLSLPLPLPLSLPLYLSIHPRRR